MTLQRLTAGQLSAAMPDLEKKTMSDLRRTRKGPRIKHLKGARLRHIEKKTDQPYKVCDIYDAIKILIIKKI
jgi:hypothetical protein